MSSSDIIAKLPTPHPLIPPLLTTSTGHVKPGLLLISGGTSQGKTTTLSSIIQHGGLNGASLPRTVSIEDQDGHHARTNQVVRLTTRPNHEDMRVFHEALLLRPEVIAIEEIRNPTQALAALSIAGTGHLAITTIHAASISEALTRFTQLVSAAGQPRAGEELSKVLLGVTNQKLLPNAQDKRHTATAFEILPNSGRLAASIRTGNEQNHCFALTNEHGQHEAVTYERDLARLVREGQISKETAYNFTA